MKMLKFTKEINGEKFDFEIGISPVQATAEKWGYKAEIIRINEEEISKEGEERKYYQAEFTERYIRAFDRKAFCLNTWDNTKKEICSKIGFRTPQDDINIVLDEFQDKWEKMKQVGIAEMERLAQEKQAEVDAKYVDENMEVGVHRFGGYGWGSSGYGQSTRGRRHIEMAERVDDELSEASCRIGGAEDEK